MRSYDNPITLEYTKILVGELYLAEHCPNSTAERLTGNNNALHPLVDDAKSNHHHLELANRKVRNCLDGLRKAKVRASDPLECAISSQ